MIKLTTNSIDYSDRRDLCEWIKTDPQLTQGPKVKEAEEAFAKWIGKKYAVMTSSGSASNLILAYALKITTGIKKVIVPTLSWATTVSPWIQFDFEILFCDTDKRTLGMEPKHLEILMKANPGSIVFAVDVLGFPNDYEKISELCLKYGCPLFIDSCETMGSEINGHKSGNYGVAATYSSFFSHIINSIEGGMITTDDFDLYETLKSLRAHGWSRDLSKETRESLKSKFKISDFNEAFTFYLPGFNVRSTEINAWLFLRQMEKIDGYCETREYNFRVYQSLIKNSFWKIEPLGEKIVNFAYPIIHPKRDKIIEALKANDIECRPLLAGSIASMPMTAHANYSENNLKDIYFGKCIHSYGLYLPNHQDITANDIEKIASIVNEFTA